MRSGLVSILISIVRRVFQTVAAGMAWRIQQAGVAWSCRLRVAGQVVPAPALLSSRP